MGRYLLGQICCGHDVCGKRDVLEALSLEALTTMFTLEDSCCCMKHFDLSFSSVMCAPLKTHGTKLQIS